MRKLRCVIRLIIHLWCLPLPRSSQFLQPLRGSHTFKETGRYMPTVGMGANRLGVRMNAFPFIEPWEVCAVFDSTNVAPR